MDEIKLTDRVAAMVTEEGAAALVAVISDNIKANAENVETHLWSVFWRDGRLMWSADLRAVPAIPKAAILAEDVPEEHQVLAVFQGVVWTIGDLAMHDLRTFQRLEFTCGMLTTQRVRHRLRDENPERFMAFCTARHPHYGR